MSLFLSAKYGVQAQTKQQRLLQAVTWWGGTAVPAGKYTIFVVPDAARWTLIINKKTGEWGIPYKYESDELARIAMTVSKLPSPIEDFTIAYDQSPGACTLRMDWETTRASVDIKSK